MRCFALIALVACGRQNFDDAGFDGEVLTGGDHDGDGVVDSIDLCPSIYDGIQADRDNDGVGDNCDPRPDTPGDVIAAVALFTTGFGTLVPDTIANWTLADGVATTASVADATQARMSVTIQGDQPTVRVGFNVLDYGVAGTDSVSLQWATNTGNWRCTFLRNGGTLDLLAVSREGTQLGLTSPTGIQVGGRAVVSMQVSAAAVGCDANGSFVSTMYASDPNVSPTFTLEVRELTVAVSDVIIYAVR